MSAVDLLSLTEPIRMIARRIGEPTLRSLDAIHLATAASLGDNLGALIGYDKRLLNSALVEGLPAVSPPPAP